MGIVPTVILGVLGSLVGGGIAYLLNLGASPYGPGGWILATLGAVVLLAFGWFGPRPRVAARAIARVGESPRVDVVPRDATCSLDITRISCRLPREIPASDTPIREGA